MVDAAHMTVMCKVDVIQCFCLQVSTQSLSLKQKVSVKITEFADVFEKIKLWIFLEIADKTLTREQLCM